MEFLRFLYFFKRRLLSLYRGLLSCSFASRCYEFEFWSRFVIKAMLNCLSMQSTVLEYSVKNVKYFILVLIMTLRDYIVTYNID